MVELSQQLPAQPYLVEDLREPSTINKKQSTSKWKPVLDRGLPGVGANKLQTNIKEEEAEEKEPSSISNFVEKLAADQNFKLKTISPKRSRHNSFSNDQINVDRNVGCTVTTPIEEKPAIGTILNDYSTTASSLTGRKRSTSSSSTGSKPFSLSTEVHHQPQELSLGKKNENKFF